jgi:hypothetical protein
MYGAKHVPIWHHRFTDSLRRTTSHTQLHVKLQHTGFARRPLAVPLSGECLQLPFAQRAAGCAAEPVAATTACTNCKNGVQRLVA